MATNELDLWPSEIATLPSIQTPITILKEQSSLLGQKTNNLVEAEVKSNDAGNGRVAISFNLVAPALNSYRYQLFQVLHHAVEIYPLTIDFSNTAYTVKNLDQLIDQLKMIFSDEKTIRVIQSLKAQSTS